MGNIEAANSRLPSERMACFTFGKVTKPKRRNFALCLFGAVKLVAQIYRMWRICILERTISGMMGKGSVSHNTRAFTAKNVNKERSRDNVEYFILHSVLDLKMI